MRHFASFVLVVAACGVARFASAEPPSNPGASDERLAAWQWFSTLGYPDVKDLKFIRATVDIVIEPNGQKTETVAPGFLIDASSGKFKAFYLATGVQTLDGGANTTDGPQVGYVADELSKYAAGALKSLETTGKEDSLAPRWGIENPLSEPTQVFILSWCCWRKGLDKLAAGLFDQAAKMPPHGKDDPFRAFGPARPEGTFRERLAADLSNAEMHRALSADQNVPPSQLLMQVDKFLKAFPNSAEAPQMRRIAATYERMVQEDKDHAARRAKRQPFDQLSKTDQIAELIFQLRDGHAADEPLAKRGYEAVPQLIDALSNSDFTPSVEFSDHGPHILTVGDSAEQILSQIAGRQFAGNFPQATDEASDAARLVQVRQEAQAWYAELQRDGEKQMLIRATEKGDQACTTLAARLAQKYPDAAVAALETGIANAQDNSVRLNLINFMALVRGDGPVPFLLRELKTGRSLDDRVAAAAVLFARKREEGVWAMIEVWKNAEGDEQPDTLVKFLAASGNADAIRALAAGLKDRPYNFRHAVVSAFSDGPAVLNNISARFDPSALGDFAAAGNPSGSLAADAGAAAGGSPANGAAATASPAGPTKAWTNAVYELLFVALDDTEDNFDSMYVNGQSCNDVRIADLAACALNQFDAKRFPFDLGGTLAQRERNRVLLVNVRRKELGLAPLAVPEPRKITAAPAAKLQSQLDRLERSPPPISQKTPAGAPPSASAAAAAEIEKLGLGALEPTLERMKSLKPAAPQRPVFDSLSRRLASIVVEIQYGEHSLPPDEALRSQFDALKGKPFDESAVVKILASLAAKMQPPAYGLKFFVFRAANEAGTTLRLDIIDRSRAISLGKATRLMPSAASERQVRSYFYIEVADPANSSRESRQGALDLSDFEKKLAAVGNASPSGNVDVGVQIIPQ